MAMAINKKLEYCCNRRLEITIYCGSNFVSKNVYAKCVTLPVTLTRMININVELVAETWGIDVSRHAESIFDTFSTWGDHQTPQPETTLCHTMSHNVKLVITDFQRKIGHNGFST